MGNCMGGGQVIEGGMGGRDGSRYLHQYPSLLLPLSLTLLRHTPAKWLALVQGDPLVRNSSIREQIFLYHKETSTTPPPFAECPMHSVDITALVGMKV